MYSSLFHLTEEEISCIFDDIGKIGFCQIFIKANVVDAH